MRLRPKNRSIGDCCGTGFYVGKRVIATAAHCLYNSVWEGDFSSGWANEGYVIQAYGPSQKDENTLKNRKYIDGANMRVGASWVGNYHDDDDYGNVVAVFIGVSPTEYGPLRSKAVSLDKWLYNALKGYE